MSYLSFGANGTYINNVTVVGTFAVINALTDCDVIIASNWINGASITVTLSAGQSIYGVFTSIQTTGKVVAYN